LIEMSNLTAAKVDDGSTTAYTFHVHTETGRYILKDGDDNLFDATVNADGTVEIGAAIDDTTTDPTNGLDWDVNAFGEATHSLTIPGKDEVAAVPVDMSAVN